MYSLPSATIRLSRGHATSTTVELKDATPKEPEKTTQALF